MKGFTTLLLISLGFSLFAQPVQPTTERLQMVRDYLQKQHHVSGYFMIGYQDKIVLSQGLGFANRENQIPFSENTLSTIGSITKPFTATAILLLMEQGKLSLQQTLSDFFHEVTDDKKLITIHQLLTHTSGLPGAIGDDYESISDFQFRDRLWKETLAFPPGEGYRYSNTGYSLLGMIIEKVSGMKYSEFLEKNIFSKAGMTTAGYSNINADYQFLSNGYLEDGKNTGTSKAKNWDGNEPYWNLKSNGGIIMSPMDMFQWYRALRSNKILKPSTLELQITPHVEEGGGSFYGYGYAVDGESVQHNGGNRIFRADFRWYPKEDLFLFSTSNDAAVRLFRLNDEIIDILRTGKLPTPIDWTPVNEIKDLPAAIYKLISAFDEVLKDPAGKSSAFIDTYATEGVIERNGREKLVGVFEMLHNDTGGKDYKRINTAEDLVQVIYPLADGDAVLKVMLKVSDGKLDRLNAEIMRE